MSEYTTITLPEAIAITMAGYAALAGFVLTLRKSVRSIEFVERLEKRMKEGIPEGEELLTLYSTLANKTPMLTPELKQTKKELLSILEQKIEQDPLAQLHQRANTNPKLKHSYFSRRRYDIRRDARPAKD